LSKELIVKPETLRNYIDGVWSSPDTAEKLPLYNPALDEVIGYVPMGGAREVDQAQGGAKNALVVMPDADLESSIRIIADSAYGNAGQRCLATSLVVTISEGKRAFSEAIVETARSYVVGSGLDEGVQMGPVVSKESKTRIQGLIQTGIDEGGVPLVDGRDPTIPGYERGYFIRPTVLDGNPLDGELDLVLAPSSSNNS